MSYSFASLFSYFFVSFFFFALCPTVPKSLFISLAQDHDMVGFWSPHFASVLAPGQEGQAAQHT